MPSDHPETLSYALLPKQLEFVRDPSRFVLYSGAIGAGKSLAVCVRAVHRASYPGAREGMCREELVTFKDTTLRTLLDGDNHPPILPPGTYEHHKSDKTISIFGGGEIVYFGLDGETKIGSRNLTGVGIDQAEELSEATWIQLVGRIRVSHPLGNSLYAACNPSSPSHWLAEYFGLASGHAPRANHCAIRTRSRDNPFLPVDYQDSLDAFTGVAHKRYVLGLWVGNEAAVYEQWDRELFVRRREEIWPTVIAAADPGFTNPACFLLICVDHDGRLHVLREFYKTKQVEADLIAVARRWQAGEVDATAGRVFPRPQVWCVDSAAASLREALSRAGIPVEASEHSQPKRVYQGIQAVMQRLSVPADGLPRLTVDPSCTNLIREFESYEWEPGRDRPKKELDHALDALRYGIVYTDGYKIGDMVTGCASYRPDRKRGRPMTTGVW